MALTMHNFYIQLLIIDVVNLSYHKDITKDKQERDSTLNLVENIINMIYEPLNTHSG